MKHRRVMMIVHAAKKSDAGFIAHHVARAATTKGHHHRANHLKSAFVVGGTHVLGQDPSSFV